MVDLNYQKPWCFQLEKFVLFWFNPETWFNDEKWWYHGGHIGCSMFWSEKHGNCDNKKKCFNGLISMWPLHSSEIPWFSLTYPRISMVFPPLSLVLDGFGGFSPLFSGRCRQGTHRARPNSSASAPLWTHWWQRKGPSWDPMGQGPARGSTCFRSCWTTFDNSGNSM